MAILLTLFFVSLFSIIFMVTRRLILQRREYPAGDLREQEISLELPYLKEIKQATARSIRRFSRTAVIAIIRFYVRSAKFLRDKYNAVKIKLENARRKNQVEGEKKEISKFFKIIAEYKRKIREIKHHIKKEEDL